MNAWYMKMHHELTLSFYHDHRRAILTLSRFSGIDICTLAYQLS